MNSAARISEERKPSFQASHSSHSIGEVGPPLVHQPGHQDSGPSWDSNDSGPSLAERLGQQAERMVLVAHCFVDDAVHAVKARWLGPWADVQHLRTLSLLTLSTVAVVGTIIWLRGVLIPFVLAVFVSSVLQPLLRWLLNPLSLCACCSARARRIAAGAEAGRRTFLVGGHTGRQTLGFRLQKMLWEVWAVSSVLACLIVVLVAVLGYFYMVFAEVTAFDWGKYRESPRVQFIVRSLDHSVDHDSDHGSDHGSEHESDTAGGSINWEKLLQPMAGPLMDVLGVTVGVLGTLFMMFLFLSFLLFNEAGSDPNSRFFGSKTRASVQRYFQIKFVVSAVASMFIWLVLSLLEVDFAFLFACATFVLNYIPHIGYTMSIIAPLPLVILDPTKTRANIIACILWPTVIHQVSSSIVEPRLLATTLDLHPVVLLAALAFWTTCWGLTGALLSTPLTCILRISLAEAGHPYADALVACMRGGRAKGAKRS